MSDTKQFEGIGMAEAVWNEGKKQWVVDLTPDEGVTNRSLFIVVAEWLKAEGWAHTIMLQRQGNPRVIAWRTD